MKPNPIAITQLAPQFAAVPLATTANPEQQLLGQDRLKAAFCTFLRLSQQGLYIADFDGIYRPGLMAALAHIASSEFEYLFGRLTRAQLFGSADNAGDLAQHKLLFIDAEAILHKPRLWEMLLEAMQRQGYNCGKQWQSVNARIVLIGHAGYYSELLQLDRAFQNVFSMFGDVADELDSNSIQLTDYSAWLQQLAQVAGCTLAASAIAPLLNHACLLTEHQQRLSLASQHFIQLFYEAHAIAADSEITDSHILQAKQQRQFRHNAQEQLSAQNVDDAFIHLPTDGERVGQICGLTVIDSGDYVYGEPARITASVHYGDGEVADIERKSELGGNIHAKGMMILSSCLYQIFGRDAPLHLSANIVFEQSYQEIDGDSASLAEYCCLISAISEQPIYQGIAVTGALDQFGNVQAIGGVNEKIEGFYNLCERRGLTGTQGVIIPRSNVQQLNLPNRIIEAVKAGKFHLYEISHVDDAIELLMNKATGKPDEDDNFPEDSLYGLVQRRLDRLAGNGDDEDYSLFSRILSKFKF
ncbi:AAA family ATPase [Shewanella avicenniae]|uniref:endopeptidase La n=1 Tax=Shewanella avicenniae TaxID=2814294 RepID=A0ABX7QUL2_9GAMM|nr:Lon-insertion domain-containing protein [Shewanella avicenniae]QSX35174.1 AAA family ATPase [Shewanella avicenniae]